MFSLNGQHSRDQLEPTKRDCRFLSSCSRLEQVVDRTRHGAMAHCVIGVTGHQTAVAGKMFSVGEIQHFRDRVIARVCKTLRDVKNQLQGLLGLKLNGGDGHVPSIIARVAGQLARDFSAFSRIADSVVAGVMASGSMRSSTIAGLPEREARSKAPAKSSVRSTVSPCPPKARA